MNNTDNFGEMERGFDLHQAIAEADRCLLCHDAPCSKGCPAGTDPGTFIRKLRFRNITGAIRAIKRNNILGGACGVLCPSARLCEKECSAIGIDRPIQISKLQRFLVEHSWKIGLEVFEKQSPAKEAVAVVGSGPAGLSCAAELAKDGYSVTVFEERPEPGGVLRYGVPAHRFTREFLEKELADIKKLGVKFKCSSPIKGDGAVDRLLKNGHRAVFIAPGLWQPMRLKGTGADAEGIFAATDFLETLRKGRSADIARRVRGKRVAVIGGGSVAIDCAESVVKLGARDVYLIYRRSYAQMPAEADELVGAQESGVQFLLLNQPTSYVAGGDGNLSGIKLIRTALGDVDESGRRSPKEVPGSEWTLDVDVVVEAVGSKAPDESPGWYPRVEVDRKKLIVVDPETGRTSVDGIFAGGDIVRGPALVVNAVQDGKAAAAAIKKYLS